MSSRTHNNEFGIQIPHKRLPKFVNTAGLSFRHNDLWNIMKSITTINEDNRGFVISSGDFSWYERKCAILDGKKNQYQWSNGILNF
jgi:hypothetical protein